MSLYQLERDGDVQELIRLLRESDNPEIRGRAADMLGGFDDHDDRRDVVNALVEAAQTDETDGVTAAAIDSLDELGGDAIEQLIADMAGVDLEGGADWVKAKAFTRALDSDLPELRMAAANGLAQFGESDTLPKLIDAFDDGDYRVRARAARAAGMIGDPRATEPLEGLLEDKSPAVRREAADALGNIANRQALQALLGLYDDPDERVRRVAIGAFGNFDNGRPVEHLVEALDDDSAVVRRTAVYSLIELLSNVPRQRSHEIRESIVDELSATEDATVVVPLVEILEESTQTAQRRNTAWLLGRVTDGDHERVIEALIDCLDDDDQMTTQFAATSLAAFDGETVEDALLEVLEDDDRNSDVRAQAIFTLGKVGGQRSRDVLERLIDETEDEQIRKRAFSAISKLGGQAGDVL